ncbi:MAG: alanine:cation symporter family protein, partial [Balneolales bacterium]
MKKFLILILSVFVFIQVNAQNTEADTGQSLDEKINEAVGPVTDFIFHYIFYPIPLKAPATADTEGVVTLRSELRSGFTKYTIKTTDGELEYLEIPTARRTALKKGDQISESTPVTQGLSIPFVVVWLVLGAIVFTFYFGFVNVRKFKLAIDVVRGRYTDPNEEGEVSHFQALTAALSATVGLGNIAGVAIAISLGGPGATLWMILAGLLGMSSKFVECTLGVRYREIDEDGTVHGGPMYYLKTGLKKRGMGFLGKVLAIFFAIMCIGASFGGGNMFQVNQAYQQFAGIVPGAVPGWLFGVFMAFFVGIVIIG